MKTAIDWFAEQYNLVGTVEYEQAKEMFKEQIKEAYYQGDSDVWDKNRREAEQYYNETYGENNL